jgi:cardiolipin synthase
MPYYIVVILFIIKITFLVTVIFWERKNPMNALTWVLMIAFVPIVGFFLYLFFGIGFRNRKIFVLEKEEEIGLKKLVTRQLKAINERNVLDNIRYKELVQMNLNLDYAICTDDNSVEIFNDGKNKIKALLKDIGEAKEFIHVVYFVIKDDQTGRKFVDALRQKALEGLDVRVIYDAMGSFFTPDKLFNNLKDAGGKVYKFSPLRSTSTVRANYRNHRKLAIIDGKIGYIGGMNIGNPYVGLDKKLHPWRDTHIRIEGSAVNTLELRFILDYRHASQEKMLEVDQFIKFNDSFKGNTLMQIVSSGPDETKSNIELGYIKVINSAKKYVYIQTPYFIPDEAFIESIRIAISSGIDVRIMIPGKPDKKLVYIGTLSYIRDVIEMGVRVFKYHGFIHSKTIVSDDEVFTIGSTNMDFRSFNLSFEANAFIYDQEIAKAYNETFKKDMNQCEEMTILDIENLSRLERVKQAICRIFSPLM